MTDNFDDPDNFDYSDDFDHYTYNFDVFCPCHLLDEILFLPAKKNFADEK